MKMLDVAIKVLLDAKKPLHYVKIWDCVNKEYNSNRVKSAKTPEATLAAGIGKEINLAKTDSRFAKYGRGIYGLNPSKYAQFGKHPNMFPL